jgi:hypothetical protein
MKNFYINTTTFKNAVQSEQAFTSKTYSKIMSPYLVKEIILQMETKKTIINVPLEHIKFVKIGDIKKVALPSDSKETDIGFIIGNNPKQRTEIVNAIKKTTYTLNDIKSINVIYENPLDMSMISRASNQSDVDDLKVFEKLDVVDYDHENLTEKVKALQFDNENKEKQHNELKVEADKLQSTLNEKGVELCGAIEKTEILEKEYETACASYQEKVKEAENLKNEYSQYKNNAENTKSTLNVEVLELQRLLSVANEEINTLRSKIHELEQEIVRLNGIINNLKVAIEQLKVNNANLQNDLNVQKSLVVNLTSDRDNHKVRADKGDNQVSALKLELNKAIGEYEMCKKSHMELEVQVQDLKKKYLAKDRIFTDNLQIINITNMYGSYNLIIPENGVLTSASFLIRSSKKRVFYQGGWDGTHYYMYFNGKHVATIDQEHVYLPQVIIDGAIMRDKLAFSVDNLNMDVQKGQIIPIKFDGNWASNDGVLDINTYEIHMNFSRNHII